MDLTASTFPTLSKKGPNPYAEAFAALAAGPKDANGHSAALAGQVPGVAGKVDEKAVNREKALFQDAAAALTPPLSAVTAREVGKGGAVKLTVKLTPRRTRTAKPKA